MAVDPVPPESHHPLWRTSETRTSLAARPPAEHGGHASARGRTLFANFLRRDLTTRYLGSFTAWRGRSSTRSRCWRLPFRLHTVFRAAPSAMRAFCCSSPWRYGVACHSGSAATGRGQHRELRRADPQGRLSARARRLRIGRRDTPPPVRRLPARARVLAALGSRFASRACWWSSRCGW